MFTWVGRAAHSQGVRLAVVLSDVDAGDFAYAPAAVSGVVRLYGRPVANISVIVTDSAGTKFVVTTDSNGAYEVIGTLDRPLMDGPATVTALIGDELVSETVTIVGGGAVVRDLEDTDPGPPSDDSPSVFISSPPSGSSGSSGSSGAAETPAGPQACRSRPRAGAGRWR